MSTDVTWVLMLIASVSLEPKGQMSSHKDESNAESQVVPGTILRMCPANERRCCTVTPFLIDWVHTKNDPSITEYPIRPMKYYMLVIFCFNLVMSWWRNQLEHFPCHWPFVRGINRSSVNFPQNGQWRGALMFSLICVWINGWVKIIRLVIWEAIVPIMTPLECNLLVLSRIILPIYPYFSGLLHWHQAKSNNGAIASE